MKIKLYLFGTLLFCLHFLSGSANSRDVFTVWDSNDLESYRAVKKHTCTIAIPDDAIKIRYKKYKRFKTRGLNTYIHFTPRTFDLSSPEISSKIIYGFIEEPAVRSVLIFSLLRGPPTELYNG